MWLLNLIHMSIDCNHATCKINPFIGYSNQNYEHSNQAYELYSAKVQTCRSPCEIAKIVSCFITWSQYRNRIVDMLICKYFYNLFLISMLDYLRRFIYIYTHIAFVCKYKKYNNKYKNYISIYMYIFYNGSCLLYSKKYAKNI